MSTIRQEQIQQRLVAEISSMLLRDLKDPRIGFVTVTGAEVTRDLKFAKVFVSVMGTDEVREQTMIALKAATGLIRGEFTRRQRLRTAPEILWQIDDTITRGARIFELLNQIKDEEIGKAPTPPVAATSESVV